MTEPAAGTSQDVQPEGGTPQATPQPSPPPSSPGSFFETGSSSVFNELEGEPEDKTPSEKDKKPSEGAKDNEPEEGKKPEDAKKDGEPEAPKLPPLPKEVKEKLATMPPEVQEFFSKQEKERHALLTRVTQEYATSTKAMEEFKPYFEDPNASNALRFLLSDEEAGQLTGKIIRGLVEARMAGKKFDPAALFGAPPPPEDKAKAEDDPLDVEKLDKLSDDELQDAFLTNPKMIRALMKRMAAPKPQPEPGKSQLETPAPTAPKAEENPITTFMQALPEQLRTKEYLLKVKGYLDENEEGLRKLGYGPVQMLHTAHRELQSAEKAKADLEAKANKEKAEKEQKARQSLPPTGADGAPTGDEELLERPQGFFR